MVYKRKTPDALDADSFSKQPRSSLEKAFNLLRTFRPDEQYLRNKDFVERLNLSKATISRLTADLVSLGYLRYSPKTGQYALGIAVLSLAHPFLSGLSLRHVARPYMRELADSIGGQVSLGMRHRGDIIYIESVRSSQFIISSPEIGAAIPILRSAIGRAYLVALDPAARERLYDSLKVQTPEEWANYGATIEETLRDAEALGFSRGFGEVRKGILSCGIALSIKIDQEIVVMNCGVPAFNLKPGRIEQEIGPQLLNTAHAIEVACGLR